MLVFCEKVFDGPIDTTAIYQYTPESTWQMVGKVDQLYIQLRCGQSTVASAKVYVDIETSNDGQSFAVKTALALTVTLTTPGQIVYGACADNGSTPNGGYVRLKIYGATGNSYVTAWIAGRSQ